MLSRVKSIPYIEYVPILFIAFVMYKIVNDINIIAESLSFITSILSCLIWGFSIAYLVNPIMLFLEIRIKVPRVLSISIIYVVFVVAIILLITIITPSLASNIAQLISTMPDYINEKQSWFLETIKNYQFDGSSKISSYIQKNLNEIVTQAQNLLNFSLNFLFVKTISLTSTIMNIALGSIVSIYALNEKEKLIKNAKKIIYVIFSETSAKNILSVSSKINLALSNFIMWKILDVLIITVLCFAGLLIIHAPYALLISIVFGVARLIPYIGALFGLIPAFLITLFIDPTKVIWVLIFMIVLDQFDSWIISTKMIGDSTGLSAFLIIVALVIGGGLFGIIGMFLSIPISSVIKDLVVAYIDNRLKEKRIEINEL